jgi:hypothetical protein
MVFRSHPIGACCMRSGRLQGFIPQKLAHFEEHILTLHTVRGPQLVDDPQTRQTTQLCCPLRVAHSPTNAGPCTRPA